MLSDCQIQLLNSQTLQVYPYDGFLIHSLQARKDHQNGSTMLLLSMFPMEGCPSPGTLSSAVPLEPL